MTLNDALRYLDAQARLLNPLRRDLQATPGDMGCSTMHVRSVDAERRSLTAIVSTGNVDRYEEIVEPKAFEKRLAHFLENPVFLAGHTHVGPGGEPTVIGHWRDMRITDEGLTGEAHFADTALANEYMSLFTGGHMKAFSVGWLTHKHEWREFDAPDPASAPGKKKKLRVFTDVELIEVSAVAVPANRQSLVRAASWGRAIELPAATLESTDLTNEISKAVEAALKKALSPEPGGILSQAVQCVVDACNLGRAISWDEADADDDDDLSERETEILRSGLRDALKARGGA